MNVLLDALRYGAIGLAAILAVLAYLLLRGEQKKAKPQPSMLKAIRQFMLFVLVIAMAGLVAEIISKRLSPESSPTPAPSFAVVEKYARPTSLVRDTYVSLHDIETLKGKRKKDDDGVERGGHTFNKGLWRSSDVMTKVLEIARPVPTITSKQALAMSDNEWEAYLNQQDDKRKRQVLDLPFARIRVSRGPVVLSDRWYFQVPRCRRWVDSLRLRASQGA